MCSEFSLNALELSGTGPSTSTTAAGARGAGDSRVLNSATMVNRTLSVNNTANYTFTVSPNNWPTEVFRDSWHCGVTLTGIIEAAEVARHQNDTSIHDAKYGGQNDPRIAVVLKW